MALGNRGGRPRKPTALHRINGTTPEGGFTENEPKPRATKIDEPPMTLEREGAQLWRDMVAELRLLGMLTDVDRAALAAYCAAFGRLAEARRQMRRAGGAVVKAADGSLRLSPWFRIEKAASETLTRLAIEFGFTPASRPRLGRSARGRGDDDPPPKPKTGDANADGEDLDDFLARRPH
jgi:P27 family predicted phage terminase small subunit